MKSLSKNEMNKVAGGFTDIASHNPCYRIVECHYTLTADGKYASSAFPTSSFCPTVTDGKLGATTMDLLDEKQTQLTATEIHGINVYGRQACK